MDFSLENIPDNILVETILPRMPINNLLKLCQTNKHIYELCSSPELWQEKIIYDYKSYYNKKPENMTWQDYYIYLSIERQIPIFYRYYRLFKIYNSNIYGSFFITIKTNINEN